jgi:DNA helicase-2/ATP-dependent DNA helicase PcrA
MTTAEMDTQDDHVDDAIDDEIIRYLDLEKPTSFLLFAGAGSGKTRSLVSALDRLRTEQNRRLWLRRQKVRVITYTNAACDEINRRLRFDPLIEVSTIHSFAWSLIGSFHSDIREWLRLNLIAEISELEIAAAKGRAGTKAAIDRELSIASKRKRLSSLDEITSFTYSPTGDNRGRDALNHSEVIAIAAHFLNEGSALAKILVYHYPILLIDESQDTNRHLMDALLAVQANHADTFCLGLFGDMMQRIYADGKVGLAEALPRNWARPAKVMNHRCPERIVRLINTVRSSADDQKQKWRSDNRGGTVRLFVLPSSTADKAAAEAHIATRMAELTGDAAWAGDKMDYKLLTLEHHMAARRTGFLDLFLALNAADRLRTGLLDGTLRGLRLFSHDVLPLVLAQRAGDEFATASVVRQRSPLLKAAALKAAGTRQPELLEKAREATTNLMALWPEPTSNPTFMDVLQSLAASALFELPDVLRNIVQRENMAADLAALLGDLGEDDAANPDEVEEAEPQDTVTQAWDNFLRVPFEQIIPYTEYVSGTAKSATHQGVKGLEFPRVMVIIDDDEARGFLFSYDKLFGAKAKTDTDIKNEREGNETSIDRTRRLFYVTCSRAEKSLAVVAYSADPNAVVMTAQEQGWFGGDEVEIVSPLRT